MWLQSLQDLPEHRLLHLRCNSGISTAVVWCHSVLGLTVAVNCQGTEVRFGDGDANVLIEESDAEYAGASLMDPADPHQPLFELANEENNPTVSHELREEAFGFGLKVLRYAGIADVDVADCVCWIIGRSFSMESQFLNSNFSAHEGNSTSTSVELLEWAQDFHRVKYPTQDRLLQASRFLFASDHVDLEAIHATMHVPLKKGLGSKVNWPIIIAVLVSFARIHEGDLEHCRHMLLSVSEYQRIHKTEHCIKFLELASKEELFSAYERDVEFDVTSSFELLGRLLLGHNYSKQYVQPAVLLSAWGWSVFFSSIDAVDPADVSVTTVRVLRGVPSRRNRRKARIIDGPTEIQMSFTNGETLIKNPQVVYFPGVSTAQADKVSVGQNSDAFQFTRTFKWKSLGVSEKTHKLGFREMQELCTKANSLRPCEHEYYSQKYRSWIDERLGLVQSLRRRQESSPTQLSLKWPRLNGENFDAHGAERVFGNDDAKEKHLYFYVTNNPAARWLQLDDLYNSSAKGEFWVFVRRPGTCLKCATENVGLSSFARTLVLL